MARVIPPGYAEVAQEFRLDGYPRPAFITYGMKITGTTTGDVDLADVLLGKFVEHWKTRLDSDVTMSGCRVRIGQDGGDPILQEVAGNQKGSHERESVSPALALLISKRTGFGGRRNRGRFFLPWGVAENVVDEAGTINSALVGQYQSTANAWLADLENGPGIRSILDGMVLLHGEGLGAPTPVTSLAVSPVISTQRRRQVRG